MKGLIKILNGYALARIETHNTQTDRERDSQTKSRWTERRVKIDRQADRQKKADDDRHSKRDKKQTKTDDQSK
jgi:hypothetical protein